MASTVTTQGIDALTGYLAGVSGRAAKMKITPILKEAWAPVVAAEKQGFRSKSGALAASIKARSGSGDFPGRFSVFAPARATTKQVAARWNKGRRQQKQFAAAAIASGKRSYNVFYSGWVESGHRIVKRNKAGVLYDTGHTTKAVHFAQKAVDALGAAAAQKAADDAAKMIVGD